MDEPATPRLSIKDPATVAIGWGIFLFVLLIYNATKAPVLSFWDCGEFITCAHHLGIPHPPGTPLFILIGRVFTLNPFIADISARVNFLSAFTSAGAAMLGYFICSRLITSWYGGDYPDRTLSVARRIVIWAGSISGALFMAFGKTNWGNSTEAEVYGASMFLMMALIWMTLVWRQKAGPDGNNPGGDRWLVALSYVALLSTGIHLVAFMAMPALFLFIVLSSPRLRREWRFWVTGVVLILATGGVSVFLWSATIWLLLCGYSALSKRWGATGWAITFVVVGLGVVYALKISEEWPVFVCVTAWGLLVLFARAGDTRWHLFYTIMLAAMLGYSSQAYTPIRSTFDPEIDMNDPQSWADMKGFLERKQYGQKSMFTRAMTRRGEWSNQLGQHSRMGFWGFFDRQYGYNDVRFLPFFALGLFGAAYLIVRSPRRGITFLLLLLIGSLGLVWYMNFADGTHYDAVRNEGYLEVRDRDYFFTPGFVLFGLAMGLGGAALVHVLSGAGRSKGNPGFAIVGGLIIAMLPMQTLRANYWISDRSRDYTPYDYAYNILQSADEGAILFTNGDNDTFPVWCLQQVYGIRPDVRLANLSLINTKWYIKQLRDKLNIPIEMSDREIDALQHIRTADGTVQRVQDRMIDAILDANRWEQPINFAVTVSAPNRKYKGQSIEDHLVMNGMAFRLVRETVGENAIALDEMRELITEKFQFRGVTDSTLHLNDNARRLVANYGSAFLFVADTLRRAGDTEGVEAMVWRAVELAPSEWQGWVYLAQLFADTKAPERLDSLMIAVDDLEANYSRIVSTIGESYRRLAAIDKALDAFERVLERDPHHKPAFRSLLRIHYDRKDYGRLQTALEDWLVDNPTDDESRQFLEEVRSQLPSTPGDSAPGSAADSAPGQPDDSVSP